MEVDGKEKGVCIGICAHNEEDTIGELLDSVMEENVPIEQIVVVVAGNDDTENIAREKTAGKNSFKVIKEAEREGQIEAQNKILRENSSDYLIFLDGDGILNEGSIEKIYNAAERNNGVASGREVAIKPDKWIKNIIEAHQQVHDAICIKEGRFSTHLGIIPSDLVKSFPHIILDDAYIENRAHEENLDIKFVEDAVKYHKMPETWTDFYRQQRKNWAGRFQARELSYKQSKTENVAINTFLSVLKNSNNRLRFFLAILAIIELFAYLGGRWDQYISGYPVKWRSN